MKQLALNKISQNEKQVMLHIDAIKTSYADIAIWAGENDIIISDMELDFANDEIILTLDKGGKTGF